MVPWPFCFLCISDPWVWQVLTARMSQVFVTLWCAEACLLCCSQVRCQSGIPVIQFWGKCCFRNTNESIRVLYLMLYKALAVPLSGKFVLNDFPVYTQHCLQCLYIWKKEKDQCLYIGCFSWKLMGLVSHVGGVCLFSTKYWEGFFSGYSRFLPDIP